MKIIGKTQSGKKVYDTFEHDAHTDFSKADHHDAAILHTKAMTKIGGKRPTDERHTYHSRQHEKHDNAFYQLS